MTDGIRQSIEAAIAYLSEHPDEARYTDSAATARLEDGLRVMVTGPGKASLATDMPHSVGGGDAAPSPGWFLRAAEASCVATLVAMRAAQLGVALADLQVTVDSRSDDRGILGMNDAIPAGPLSTRVVVRITRAGADEQPLEPLVRWALAHCPVTDAVSRSVPIDLEVTALG